MHDRSYALFTAVFILALAIAIGATAWWLADVDTQRRPYELATAHSVSGLTDASRVYYRGVRAGRVEAVRITPEGEIRIRIEIDRDIPITHGTFATMQTQGLTGISHLELEDTGEDPRSLATTADDPARIPLRPGLLDRLADTGEAVFDDIERIAGRIERLLSEDNIERVDGILANLKTASGDFIGLQAQAETALAAIPDVAADASHSLARIDAVTADLHAFMPRLDDIADDFSQLARDGSRLSVQIEQDVGRLSDQLERDVGGLSRRIDRDVIPDLQQTLDRVYSAADDVSRLSRGIEEEPGSLIRGRLPHRPGPGERGYRPQGGQ